MISESVHILILTAPASIVPSQYFFSEVELLKVR